MKTYEEQMAEYNKQMEEYNKQMQAYQQQMQAYQQAQQTQQPEQQFQQTQQFQQPEQQFQQTQQFQQPEQQLQQTASQEQMQPVNEVPKKTGKKKLIPFIIAGVVLVALIVVALCIFVFPNMGAKGKVKKAAKQYAEYIESCDAKALIKATAPKELIKKAILEAADKMGCDEDEIDSIKDDFNDEYSDMMDEVKDVEEDLEDEDVKIELKDFKVKSVKKANVQEIIEKFFNDIEVEEIEGYTPADIYEEFCEMAEQCEIDVNKIYRVDISYKLDIETEDYDMDDIKDELEDELDGTDTEFDIETPIDHLYAYEYDGEYYIIPGVEDAFTPALKQYMKRSKFSSDVMNASSISTALYTAFSDEQCYDDMYEAGLFNKYIVVSEEGLKELPQSVRDEFLRCLGSIPEVKSVENSNFVFLVDGDNWNITVYLDDKGDNIELYPNTDYDYFY